MWIFLPCDVVGETVVSIDTKLDTKKIMYSSTHLDRSYDIREEDLTLSWWRE